MRVVELLPFLDSVRNLAKSLLCVFEETIYQIFSPAEIYRCEKGKRESPHLAGTKTGGKTVTVADRN